MARLVHSITNSAILSRAAVWLAATVVGLLFIIPFIATFALELPGSIVPSFGFKWLGMTVGIAAIALIPYVANAAGGIRVPYVILLPLALILIALYQAVTIQPPYLAPYLSFTICLAWAAGLATLGASLAKSADAERIIIVIAWMAMIGGLASSIIGWLQIIGVPNALSPWILPHHRHMPVGNVGHYNYFTAHVMLGLLALTALFGCKRIGLKTFIGLLTIFASVLAFTSSRAIYLYFSFALLWAAWVEYKVRSTTAKRTFLTIMVACATFLALHFWLPGFVAGLQDTSLNTALSRFSQFKEEGQFASRIDAWHVSLELFAQHPLLGVGIGEYPWHHFQLTESGRFGTFGHPHNLLLFFMATTGIAGTSLVIALFYLLARRILNLVHAPALWMPTSIVLIVMIYSMLEFPFWLPAFLGITAFFIGWLMPDGWHIDGSKLTSKLLFGICSIFVVYLLIGTLKDYQRLNAIDQGRITGETIDKEARIAHRNPWLKPYAEQLFVKGDITDRQTAHARLRINSRLLHWRPTERTLAKQAILLSIAGDNRAALDIFNKASELHKKIVPAMLKFCDEHPVAELESLCDAAKAKSNTAQ